mgnify:CR=1 FL=1
MNEFKSVSPKLSSATFSITFAFNFSVSQLPGVDHNAYEVFVVINVGAHCGIIVVPFRLADLSVAVLISERGQEVREDLIICHLAGLDLRVHLTVIDTSQIGSCNDSVAVRVKLTVGSLYNLHSCFVGAAAESDKELIEANDTVAVEVQMVEQ